MEQKTEFKVGDMIRIYHKTPRGERIWVGEIQRINSVGTLFGTWGGSEVYPDRQKIEIVDRPCLPCQNTLGQKFVGTDQKIVLMTASDLETAFRNILDEVFEKKQKSARQLTRNEAARRLGVNLSTIHRWVKTGMLHPIRSGARVNFWEQEVDDIICGIR